MFRWILGLIKRLWHWFTSYDRCMTICPTKSISYSNRSTYSMETDYALLTFHRFQKEHRSWAIHNFPDAVPIDALIGMMEELGELSHAMLKMKQGIRGNSATHRAEAKDAIGDLLIYLTHFCTLEKWDLQSIIETTWEQVSKRDWKKYPLNGISPGDQQNGTQAS